MPSDQTKPDNRLEVWGGIECTVNRVRDSYFNQLLWSGHFSRPEDLDAIAALKIKRLRYPVLWELTAPDANANIDWSWADARLSRLRSLSIEPIVGFVHHGSGPRHTSLLDDSFVPGLARYAELFARRFPWVERYTPVNEPLTTARFSGLYGRWYPHAADERSFLRALVNQCRAVVLAMRAVRCVNPTAELVQTDDLGRVYSTPALKYQADFENERRWLAWDLLCGRVDRQHPLFAHLINNGITEPEVFAFRDEPCTPAIIGINHYLTSHRFLDENHECFPALHLGGNGRDVYADVEAVRIRGQPKLRVRDLLRETWDRYRLPIAVTEAHLGCTREEQLRWLQEVWADAREARTQGIDVRAVTAWALLGSFNWNSLVTVDAGQYEPGAFDVRGPAPRATALARLIKALAEGSAARDAVIDAPGWWQRADRFFHTPLAAPDGPTCASDSAVQPAVMHRTRTQNRVLLVCGATGTLGQAFARICDRRGLTYRLCSRAELDICSAGLIGAMLDEARPWSVINAAGYVKVDDAEREWARCYRENSVGPRLLAVACAARSIPFLTFSSDLVFDGVRGVPYSERDPVAPINVYGSSKAHAERVVLAAHPEALVVRTSAFFGPWDKHNFLTIALSELAMGRDFTAIDDLIVSPTYVPDLVDACLDLLIDRASGLWHIANQGSSSWAELARGAADLAGVSTRGLRGAGWRSVALRARRPSYSVLRSERGMLLPPLEDALVRYLATRSG